MASSELVAYIYEQTQQGISAEVLRQTLMEAGWLELDIDNALHDVAAGLTPVTQGVSLHEDVSQVRSLVAHLATRVKTLEAKLTSVEALPAQMQLPAPHPRGAVGAVVGTIVFMAAFLWAAPFWVEQTVMAAVVGAVLLVAGYVAMRRHHPQVARVAIGTAVATWTLATMSAYFKFHYLERTTALAIGLLLIVLVWVMGRWVDRATNS